MEGWTRDGEPQEFSAENLFEYIDGAADLYLSYGFEELAAAAYDRGDKMSVSIEIYRMSALRDAFGIYSQEKPQNPAFLAIDTQGYHVKGALNFFHGRYYVKLIGYSLGDEDQAILEQAASEIAGRIGGDSAFPAALRFFPEEKKVPGSERFLADNVLGHAFLHSAFTADYHLGGRNATLFLIEARDDLDARSMLDAYLGLARSGGQVREEEGSYRFQDPRRASAPPFHLRKQGRYLWGVSENDPAAADSLLDSLERRLPERALKR